MRMAVAGRAFMDRWENAEGQFEALKIQANRSDTSTSHHHGESGALSRPVCATEPTSEANAGAATTATWDRRLPRPGRTVLNSGG